jgi:hypothetical protein
VKKILSTIEEVLSCHVNKCRLISRENNFVYLLHCDSDERLVLKIFNGVSHNKFEDLDNVVFPRLPVKISRREIVYTHKSTPQLSCNFTVSRYVEGESLSNVLYSPRDWNKVYQQLVAFFEGVSGIESSGFGRPDSDLKAPYSNWEEFLVRKTQELSRQARILSLDLPAGFLTFLEEQSQRQQYPQRVGLFPADLNCSNFKIDPQDNLTVIDIGSYFRGDLDCPYSFMGVHTFGTELGNLFLGHNQFYSLLEGLSLLCFVKQSHPFTYVNTRILGNNLSLAETINKFYKEALQR